MTSLSGFASLNSEWLAPHDTINAIIKTADGSHGTFELSFAAPIQSRESVGNHSTIITGTRGYMTIDLTKATDPVTRDEKPIFRIVIKSVSPVTDGKSGTEREDVIDEPMRGVELELASFFTVTSEGKEDGLGSPRGALRDVALIEAALKSNGNLIDLENLVAPA